MFAALVLVASTPVVARTPKGIDTQMSQGYLGVGIVLLDRGDVTEAERMITESLRRWPHEAMAWYTLGHIRMQQARYADAQGCFERTLRLDPNYKGAHGNLGVALTALGCRRAALGHSRRAADLQPDDAVTQANPGSALVQGRRMDEGLQHFRRALEIDSSSAAQTLLQASQGTLRQGRSGDAIDLLKLGVAHAPKHVDLLMVLSRLLAVGPDPLRRDPPEAVRLAERACQATNWQNPYPIDALATAHYAAGQREQAINAAQQAINVAEQQGQASLAEQIRARLRRYQAAASLP